MVSDKSIVELLRANSDPKAACQALVNTANAAGGRDNITAVILDV